MGVSTGTEASVRLLGLGNELLADDAFGVRVVRAAKKRFGRAVDAVATSETGFNLIDSLVGASRLLVVDTVATGAAKPGAIFVFDEDHMHPAPGQSPHFVGLFEVLAVARKLGLRVPGLVKIIAVEAADCTTVGGPMHRDVEIAVQAVTQLVGQYLEEAGVSHG